MDALTPHEIRASRWMPQNPETVQARLFAVQRHHSEFVSVYNRISAVVAKAGLGIDILGGNFQRINRLYGSFHLIALGAHHNASQEYIEKNRGSLINGAADISEEVVQIAAVIGQADTRIGQAVLKGEDPFERTPEQETIIEARLTTLGLQAIVMNFAVSLWLLSQSLRATENKPEEMGNAARLRRARQRKNLGIVGQIPISLFRGDIAILRSLGFLSSAEADDKDAQARAMENFIAASMLVRIDPQIPRKYLWDSQKGRMAMLGFIDPADE